MIKRSLATTATMSLADKLNEMIAASEASQIRLRDLKKALPGQLVSTVMGSSPESVLVRHDLIYDRLAADPGVIQDVLIPLVATVPDGDLSPALRTIWPFTEREVRVFEQAATIDPSNVRLEAYVAEQVKI